MHLKDTAALCYEMVRRKRRNEIVRRKRRNEIVRR